MKQTQAQGLPNAIRYRWTRVSKFYEGTLSYGEGGVFWRCGHRHHSKSTARSCARRHRMHLHRTKATIEAYVSRSKTETLLLRALSTKGRERLAGLQENVHALGDLKRFADLPMGDEEPEHGIVDKLQQRALLGETE